MVQETGVQSQVESYPRHKKRVLGAVLLNTLHYKVRIKGNIEQSGWGTLPEKGAFGSSSTTVFNFSFIYIYIYISVYTHTHTHTHIHIYIYIYIYIYKALLTKNATLKE